MTSPPERYDDLRSPLGSDEEWPENPAEQERLRRSAEARRVSERRPVAMRELPRGPPAAYTISQELYDKAAKHNDQLTDEERGLLLSRGDAVGKALARPESLTPLERCEVLGRPPPDLMRTNIRRATGGSLSTPAEVYAKVRKLWETGDLDLLHDEEVALLSQEFRDEPKCILGSKDKMLEMRAPGYAQACDLLKAQEGFHSPSYCVATSRLLFDPDLAARRQARQQQRAIDHPSPPQFIQVRPSELNILAVDLDRLQKRWADGAIADTEYRAQAERCIRDLKLLAQRPPEHAYPSNLPVSSGRGSSLRGSLVESTAYKKFLKTPSVEPSALPVSEPAASGHQTPSDPTGPFDRGASFTAQAPHTGAAGASSGHSQDLLGAPKQSREPHAFPPYTDVRRLDSTMKSPDGRPMWAPAQKARSQTYFFSEYLRGKIKAEGLEIKDYTTYLGQSWNALTDEEKQPFLDKWEEARLASWDRFHARWNMLDARFKEAREKRKAMADLEQGSEPKRSDVVPELIDPRTNSKRG